MPQLAVTLIDVGAGDSILIEIRDQVRSYFGLIDSNDSTYFRSSFIYLKRFFEHRGILPDPGGHLFEFVLLTHEHTDHAQGLKAIIRTWGTKRFWYPKSLVPASFSGLLRFVVKSSRVQHYESLDTSKLLPSFGGCPMEVLWPRPNQPDPNPNNNSVVLRITNGVHEVVLTGDAEEAVWTQIAGAISPRTAFFKVPHHGSVNGTLDARNQPLWLHRCPPTAQVAMSTHVVPHGHPDDAVLVEMSKRGVTPLRTDHHHHIQFLSDGVNSQVQHHR